MLESLQNIQKEIEYVIDGISQNHPLRNHLITANKELNDIINTYELEYYDNEV